MVGRYDQELRLTRIRWADSISAPANWFNATGVFRSGTGRVEIWYYPNNPGGITSPTFTASTGTNKIIGQLSEWRGAAFTSPVDQTGTVSGASATTTTVSTSAATTITGDLAVTGFATEPPNTPECKSIFAPVTLTSSAVTPRKP